MNLRNNWFEIEQILLSKRAITSDGHWLWTGSISSSGYGHVQYDGKVHDVHKIAAMLWLGHDLKNRKEEICHKIECPFKECFNPDHLYRGSRSSNMKDLVKDGTHCMTRKTHCPQGHPYSEENTAIYYTSSGINRQCKICNKERCKEFHRKKKLLQMRSA